MEKIKITLRDIRNKKLEMHDNEIEFVPYIGIQLKYALMADFVDTLFVDDDFIRNYALAKNALILGIVDGITNIDVSTVSIDGLLGTNLWDKISSEVTNYKSFMEELKEVIDFELKRRDSYHQIMEKISGLIDKVSQTDLSQEGIAKLLKTFDEKIDEATALTNPRQARKPRTKRAQ